MGFIGKDNKLWQEINSVAEDEGLALYDLEKLGAKTLRITVRNPESVKEGVSIEGCAKVCKRLQTIFTTEAPEFGLSEDLELDVSSPGVNRALRTEEHFTDAIGERISLTWVAKDKSSRSVKGTLTSFVEKVVTLEEEGRPEDWRVEFGKIKKANIDFIF